MLRAVQAAAAADFALKIKKRQSLQRQEQPGFPESRPG
jgi:hypothetical protein